MLEGFDLNSIRDLDGARTAICILLNLVEELNSENRRLREETQRLRDEINRLKGEQGRPSFPAKKKPASAADHSSEGERHKPKEWKKEPKVDEIRIDREEVLTVDKAQLPADAEFKGYEPVVVQDIRIRTDNVRFLKEKWYSAQERQTYLAPLPAGYEGEFGPGIKALAITLSFGANVSEAKIRELLGEVGIQISDGQLSNLLIKDQERFHAEKDAIFEAGLSSSPWQHLDDTETRVNGETGHCHVVCNPLFTAYPVPGHRTGFTTPRKDRLTVIDVLRNGRPRVFRLNEEAYSLVWHFTFSERLINGLHHLPQEQDLSEGEFLHLLETHLPRLGVQRRDQILDAAAIAAHRAQVDYPVVRALMCDGAPQFKLVTEELAECWIHEGRHYKKLNPCVPYHRQLLEGFLKEFWEFPVPDHRTGYDELLEYQKQPTQPEAQRLSARFDELFSQETGYACLDARITITRSRKETLLLILDHPEIPLHNNPAELGARARVRKRKVSFGPRTEDGKRAWDTFMTIASTAKKLGVSFYHYIHDRVSGAYAMPSFADLIKQRAACPGGQAREQLNLGASWDVT